MALRRTTVWAEESDLALIKEAAARDGVAEAEIIREAIHLAAQRSRRWADPFFPADLFVDIAEELPERSGQSAREVLDEVYDEKAAAYRRARTSRDQSAS